MGRDQLQDRIADRYRLLEPIGRGGSGVVWRAQDLLLQRKIAMKELVPPAGIEEEDRRRLQQGVLREARAAARLQHPGAVAVYDVVEEGERQFIVMELVEAPDLSQVVNGGGPLAPSSVAAIGLELLEVLQAAHESGIVHRDVKPGNVLVPSPGRCRLSDFGIASLIDDPSITATGMVKGTPSYMSPEQAMAATTSPATDMWSLGATLYFAVEGHPPFDKGQPIATLTAITTEEPEPFVRAGPLGAALQPLFRKDPAARPDHEALRRGLQSVVANGYPGGRALSGLGGEGAPLPPTKAMTAARPALPVERAAPATVWTDAQSPPTEVRPSVPAVAPDRSGSEATPHPPAPPVGPWAAGPGPGAAPGQTARIAQGPRATVPSTRSTRPTRRKSFVVAAVVVVVLLLAGYLVSRSGSGTHGGPAAVASRAPTTAPGAATHSTAPPAVPSGWKSYTDPDTGFRLAYPPTWTIVRNGTLTDFRDPATGTYLRIDHQSPPAASADGAWYQLEPEFAASNPGYQRLGITRTTFHGYAAANWEYTYRGGFQQLHAIDIGMIVGDHGFGFNFQTTDAAWAQDQPLLNQLESGFQP